MCQTLRQRCFYRDKVFRGDVNEVKCRIDTTLRNREWDMYI